jgi:hypothetical protein
MVPVGGSRAALSKREGWPAEWAHACKAQPRFRSYTRSTRSSPADGRLAGNTKMIVGLAKARRRSCARSSLSRSAHAVHFENKIVDENKIAARQNGGGAQSPHSQCDGDCFDYATAPESISAAGSDSRTGGRFGLKLMISSVPVIAPVPSNRLVQLVLGNAERRQTVIPMMVPFPPQEVAIRRSHSGVVPDPAIAGPKLDDGVVRVCRSRCREGQRQRANGES